MCTLQIWHSTLYACTSYDMYIHVLISTCILLYMQEPIEVSFGDPYFVPGFSGTKRRLVQKQDTFQYVSLLGTLRNILKTDILEYVLQPHGRDDELLEDFCDGQRFKSHALFSTNPHALQIIGYFDELEVCNPLGTHTKTHKLGIFLFTLANIPPMKRSTLKTHFLFAAATRPTIEKYGMDPIIEPFIDDLRCLSTTGIDVTVDGIERTFYGGLLTFLGDNLALNAIGGFKESFSVTFRCCRTCLATSTGRKETFDSSMFQVRSDDVHQ